MLLVVAVAMALVEATVVIVVVNVVVVLLLIVLETIAVVALVTSLRNTYCQKYILLFFRCSNEKMDGAITFFCVFRQ